MKSSKTIHILYQDQKIEAVIEQQGIAEWKLKQLLNIPLHISIYTKILSLVHVHNGKEIELTENEHAKSLQMLKADELVDGGEYKINVKDMRREAINSLSEDEQQLIKEKFNLIDIDHSGQIDLDEVKAYYKKESDAKKNELLSKAEMIIEKKPEEKIRIMGMYQKAADSLDHMVDVSIRAFMKQDVDNDNQISYDEFLLHEAKLTASRKAKQKLFDVHHAV
mmetsp:Transcript_6445/g.9385  ORF Transcript_6445/g.9385 Transcript_6445/m.9385 type:complete len:222 (-) Transcript_6445:2676-3341(-)